jgi:RNA polymerase sigma factor (sigma-70 family)
MAHESPLPESLPLAALEAACRQETRRFRNAGVGDSRFCFEIFRRALLHTADLLVSADGARTPQRSIKRSVRPSSTETTPTYGDEAARTVLVQIYTDYIKAHINREAARMTPLDDLVQQVWFRFWRAANNQLIFPSLEAALNYLKQTTISTLLEDQRQWRKRQRDTSLHEIMSRISEHTLIDSSADLFLAHIQQRFRDRCREVLTDPFEYRVFWMRYGRGLPPREIARELDGEGVLANARPMTARTVSDLLERCCRRLRTDPEIQDLLRGD